MVHKMLNDIVHTLRMVRGCSFTLVFASSEDLFYFVECVSWFGRIPDYSAAASHEVESPRHGSFTESFRASFSIAIFVSHSDVLPSSGPLPYRMVSSWTVEPYRWRHYAATPFYSREWSWLARRGESPNSRDDGGEKHIVPVKNMNPYHFLTCLLPVVDCWAFCL